MEKEAYRGKRKDEEAGRVHLGKLKQPRLAVSCSVEHNREGTGGSAKCRFSEPRNAPARRNLSDPLHSILFLQI